MGVKGARQNNAIERSQLTKKAKPLGELIVAASRGKIPPPPVVSVVEKARTTKEIGEMGGRQRRANSRAKPSTVRESVVLHDCLRYLKKRGIFAYRQNTGTLWTNGQPVSFGYPGSADITGILPDGRRLEVECKSATGRQSEKQKKFEEKIRTNGGIYILARSVEDLEHGLRLYENTVVPNDLPE